MITSGNVDGNGSLEYYPIQAHDLGLLQWAFYIARHCNNPSEDPVESPFKFRFTNINKFVGEVIDIDMISRVSATMDQSLGAFLFNDEKSFPIQINFDYEENADVLKTPLYIASGMGDNPPVDAFGNLITDANTMTSAGNLRDIFLERVAEPYYSSNVLWNYIDQISDLELVLPNDG
jgi:hypothetical protein